MPTDETGIHAAIDERLSAIQAGDAKRAVAGLAPDINWENDKGETR